MPTVIIVSYYRSVAILKKKMLYKFNDLIKNSSFNIVSEVANASSNEINKVLEQCNYSCKHALIMILKKVSFSESTKLLQKHHNQINNILKNLYWAVKWY